MNKIMIGLSGGVGNQLSQIAYALYIQSNFDKQVLLDFSKLKRSPHSSKADIIVNLEKLFGYNYKASLLDGIFAKKYMEIQFVDSPSFLEAKNIRPRKLTGYFQHFKYGEKVREQIVSCLNEDLLCAVDKYRVDCNPNAIGVHFRGGDYFMNLEHNKKFGVVDLGYFQRAIDFICSKRNFERNKIQVDIITDDQNAAELLFKSINLKKNYICSDWYNDFCMIGAYENFIIPNSTFSWWSRFFLDRKEYITTMPNSWSKTLDERYFNFKTSRFFTIGNSFL